MNIMKCITAVNIGTSVLAGLMCVHSAGVVAVVWGTICVAMAMLSYIGATLPPDK